MTSSRATRELQQLTEFDGDDAVNVALESFASVAAALSPAQLAAAVLVAVDAMGTARPEWTETECRAATLCALRERERVQRVRRRAA